MGKPRWSSRNLNRDASLVTPSLWAVGQTLIALDRRGLRIPRSFHSKWIAQRGRHGRRLQGEFREQCSGIKRAVGRILMCVKESEQCKDAIGYAAERRLRARSQLPHRFFDRPRKNLSTKWTAWSPSGSA